LTKYAVFTGRATRSEYWWFILAQALLGAIAGVIDESLNIIVSLLFLLPTLAVAVRRLHDIGKKGWWYLLVFIPIIGWIVLLYWFVQPSLPEANEYGEAPIL
jgi:uncharacterized membrane protein YhaH (DUF805 family)